MLTAGARTFIRGGGSSAIVSASALPARMPRSRERPRIQLRSTMATERLPRPTSSYRELADLRDRGALTQDEFEEEKGHILSP